MPKGNLNYVKNISVFVVYSNQISISYSELTLFGIPQYRHLSSLPGLSKAVSMRSGRLVAPKMYTPCSPSTPSSWVKSWLTTLSVTPVLSWPRFGARESNSSKNKMQGFALCALWQKREEIDILSTCSDRNIFTYFLSGRAFTGKYFPIT